MSTEDNKINFGDIMADYWNSRGLVVVGIVLATWCPFPMLLLPIIMVVDFFTQNPVLPINGGMTPQESLTHLSMWLQLKYKWVKEQSGLNKSDKVKKME